MNKKSLFLMGLGFMALGAYLYAKAKFAAQKAEEVVGDAVADKVGDVTETILNKVKQGNSATETIEDSTAINPAKATLPPKLSPLPAPSPTIMKDREYSVEDSTLIPEAIPNRNLTGKSSVTITNTFDGNNWQNMVN